MSSISPTTAVNTLSGYERVREFFKPLLNLIQRIWNAVCGFFTSFFSSHPKAAQETGSQSDNGSKDSTSPSGSETPPLLVNQSSSGSEGSEPEMVNLSAVTASQIST